MDTMNYYASVSSVSSSTVIEWHDESLTVVNHFFNFDFRAVSDILILWKQFPEIAV